MAEAVYSLPDCDVEIRLKIECETLNRKSNLTQSEISEIRESLSKSSDLELKLDIDELQELHTMCTRQPNRNYIAQMIAQLETIRNKIPYHPNSMRKEKKWSDIVAGRNPQASKPNAAATHNIETVITSRPSHPSKEIHEMEINNINQSSNVRKDKKYHHHDGRPRIVVLGDSHARGIAGELIHQSNHHFNITGYVKPNAKLSGLLNSAKSELCKLTKSDTIIMIGGSNDIDKNEHSKNLTSIRYFLEGTQNTNVSVVEVPLRYDTGARAYINEQIERYNKKLYKITKSFRQVKMVKVTTNREDFTKHGLHLSNKGKEKMTNELLKNLAITQKSPKTAAIHLPWKSEITVTGVPTAKTARPDEVQNISIGAEFSKETGTLNAQQVVNQETCNNSTKTIKETSKNSKLQRNCPKVKNDDFLWN
jgi:hypothetical protein